MPSVEHVPLTDVDRREYRETRAQYQQRYAHSVIRKQRLSKSISLQIDFYIDRRRAMEKQLTEYRQAKEDDVLGPEFFGFNEYEHLKQLEKVEEKIGNFSARKKEIDSLLADRSKALAESIGDMTGILKAGWHRIEVARVLDPFVGELRFVHLQTKEVLRTRALEANEKQESLPYVDGADLRWDQQLEEPDEWTRRVLASRKPAEVQEVAQSPDNVTPIRSKKTASKPKKSQAEASDKPKSKAKRSKTTEAVNA